MSERRHQAALTGLLLAGLWCWAVALAAAPTFDSDVPDLSEAMLAPVFWLQKLEDDALRMDREAIQAFNQRSYRVDPNLHDLDQWPAQMPREQVTGLIRAISRPAAAPRFFADSGEQVSAQDYARWDRATHIDAVPTRVTLRWGLAVRRAGMRSYPTAQRILKTPEDIDLDRLQETAVFPGERLAVLHESEDGQWLFAVNYHYAAWLPRDAVALGERGDIERWLRQQPRLTVTGARAFTNYQPRDPRLSELQLDMGVSLPLLSTRQAGHDIAGQNPVASHIVSLPLRRVDGGLEFAPALIARSQDVHEGPLPFTPANLLRQSFKFLGERYGWGHDYNGRDCTGFVGEVYKSVGIVMPRNTGQQADSAFAPTVALREAGPDAIDAALRQLRVGDLIYIPGHVMLYIGRVDDEPYVIHDVAGLRYLDADGRYYEGTLGGVSVTPLTPLRLSADVRFIDRITAIKHIAGEVTP